MIDFKKFQKTETPQFIPFPASMSGYIRSFLERDNIDYKIHRAPWNENDCPMDINQVRSEIKNHFLRPAFPFVLQVNISKKDILSELDRIYFYDLRDPEVTEIVEYEQEVEREMLKAPLNLPPEEHIDGIKHISGLPPFVTKKIYSKR